MLKEVDEQVLKDFGISSAGHRLRLCSAIAKLGGSSNEKASASTANLVRPEPQAASLEQKLKATIADLDPEERDRLGWRFSMLAQICRR